MMKRIQRPLLRLKWAGICAAATALVLVPATQAWAADDTTQFTVTAGTLAFTTDPNVPDLPGLTLNGQSQTLNATMADWTARDATGAGAGWNVTVVGDGSALKSAVFKEYCTDGTSTNGCDTAVGGGPGPGYVTGGKTLAANSLTLDSTGAAFTAQNGTTGTAPTHSCGTPCNVDVASAVKIASAASGAGMGTYQANTYSGTSLALAAPTTIYAIGTGNKVYRVNLTWTLNSGP